MPDTYSEMDEHLQLSHRGGVIQRTRRGRASAPQLERRPERSCVRSVQTLCISHLDGEMAAAGSRTSRGEIHEFRVKPAHIKMMGLNPLDGPQSRSQGPRNA